MFNLRSGPFESYDSNDSCGHMGELIGNHLKTLAEYPPVQAAKSFDRSNLVQDFLRSQQPQR
jgi:arylsulfatase